MQPVTPCLKSHAVWGYVARPLLYVKREEKKDDKPEWWGQMRRSVFPES